MKKFEGVFWRGNPQLANGGYETKRQFNAKSYEGAKRQAKKHEKCLYGSMELLDLYEVKAEVKV